MEYYPEYLNSFNEVMSSRSAHMFNMFIMKRKFLNSYSTWLFDILGKLEDRIDITNYSVQESRVYGYVSELLMDVWINKNNVDYVEVNWGFLGKSHTIIKMFNFLKRKFFNTNVNVSKTHF